MSTANKTQNLPKIYYINLDEATDRNEKLLSDFDKYKIKNFERFSAVKVKKSNHRLLSANEFGCLSSHVECFRRISDGIDDYAIVLEDDIDLSAIEQWDFTWDELMSNLPEFGILQLMRNQLFGKFLGVSIKVWDDNDRSTGAYLVTKSYAKFFIEQVDKCGTSFRCLPCLDPGRIGPVADYSLYSYNKTLSINIFKQHLLPSQVSSEAFPGPTTNSIKRINEYIDENGIKLKEVLPLANRTSGTV